MLLQNIFDPIMVNKSSADSRSLIMPHQQEAVDAMTEYFKVNSDIPDRNGLVVMPTGSGKTYTAVTWLLSQGVANGYRIVWLVHRQELVEQTYQEFRKQVPLLQGSGINKIRILPISANCVRMSSASKADVYVCSIASVANKYGYRFIQRMIGVQGKRKLIVVVDEAHHAVAGNYQKVINRLTTLNPNRILLGLTATPYRMQPSEQRRLQKMFNIDKNIIHKIGKRGFVYEVTLNQLLANGFLAKPIYIPVKTNIIGDVEYDISDEDREFFAQYGELTEKLKLKIAKSNQRNKIILNEYLKNKEKYGKTIIFAVNQMHAEILCDEFKKAGISCDYAVSDRKESQEIISQFKNGKRDVLINVQMMTEGSDCPDIQTVFLTRETNSDSLLMQMIGRGLRGEKAGGTKTANIVAFHDTWDKFMHWMDPGSLDVFDMDENSDEDGYSVLDTDIPEICPNEEMLNQMDLSLWLSKIENTSSDEPEPEEGKFLSENVVSSRDLYLKLYSLMKVNILSRQEKPLYPFGWYSLIDEAGNEKHLLAFESQKNIFEDIKNNISNFIGKINIDSFKSMFFTNVKPVPEDDEIGLFIDYIEETSTMPPFFTFEQREALEPVALAAELKEKFSKDEDREEWLKELYERSAVLQNIYKYFYAFKKTVYDAMKDKKESIIVTEDDKKEYEIIDNYYNLTQLLDELKDMYPNLLFDRVIKIAWSKEIVRDWCALCQQVPYNEKMYFQLTVNKMFSSPKVDRELVKYLIFHELLHANGWWDHDSNFRDREWQYPNSAEYDGIIDTLCIEYNIKPTVKNEIPEIDYAVSINSEKEDEKVDKNLKEDLDDTNSYNKQAKGVIEGFKYCRNCGYKLPESAKFCNKCGERVDY